MTALFTADYIGWHHNMGAGSWILMVLFWALVIAGIVWLVMAASRNGRHERPGAIGVLDHRLAKGEISVDEYRERREAMAGSSSEAASPTSESETDDR